MISTTCLRLLLFASLCLVVGCGEVASGTQLDMSLLSEVKANYAPDKRTDRVEVEVKGDTLFGYTTRPGAKAQLDSFITHHKLVNEVKLLPSPAVAEKPYGIIKVSVANLRSEPGHSQELATQALLGTPIQVLDEKNNWFLVRTPDRYLAWLEPGAFVRLTQGEMKDYLQQELRFYNPELFGIQSAPYTFDKVLDAVDGTLVNIVDEPQGSLYREIELPDSTKGFVATRLVNFNADQLNPDNLNAEALVNTASGFTGKPYLWGGTSPNGMDCSGFTKTVYYLHGFVIPRDASQQFHAGTEVRLTDDFSSLQTGDLLFFGTLREDGSQRITHVGFYLGDGRVLHAGADNGHIRENNLIPGKPGYNEKRRNTLLRAKRLSSGAPGVRTIREAFSAILLE